MKLSHLAIKFAPVMSEKGTLWGRSLLKLGLNHNCQRWSSLNASWFIWAIRTLQLYTDGLGNSLREIWFHWTLRWWIQTTSLAGWWSATLRTEAVSSWALKTAQTLIPRSSGCKTFFHTKKAKKLTKKQRLKLSVFQCAASTTWSWTWKEKRQESKNSRCLMSSRNGS